MKRNLTRKERLSKKSDVLKMLKIAKKFDCIDIKLYYINNNLKWNRVAILLKKGFYSAVHRNREKRIVKEVYRNLKNSIKIGFDIIFLIYPVKYSYANRFSQLKHLLTKADMFLNCENI